MQQAVGRELLFSFLRGLILACAGSIVTAASSDGQLDVIWRSRFDVDHAVTTQTGRLGRVIVDGVLVADVARKFCGDSIYILEGTMRGEIGGKAVEGVAGTALYLPAGTLHTLKATTDRDVMFFTVKDASHSLHGIKYQAQP